jgi:hypothetical protein
MRPKSIIVGLTPADADGICAAQTTAGAAELNLSGGALSATANVARMYTATQITITCAADETGRKFTVYGRDSLHRYIEEKITGVSATAATSTLSYTEVYRVEIDGAASGNVSVGVSGDADAIALAQQPTASSALTLAGIFTYEATMFGIAETSYGTPVKVYSTGDNSGDTLTIYGQDNDGVDISEAMAGGGATSTATSTKSFKKVYAIYSNGALTGATYAGWAEDVDGIAKSQTISGAGYFIMNGARCTKQARHISITSAGSDESGITFYVVGLDRRGDRITEEITGPTASATVKGDKNFSVIRAIYVSGALTGNVTVGSADECESQPIPVDYYTSGMSVGIYHSTSSSLTHRFLDTLDVMSQVGDRNEHTARWNEETGNKTADETLHSTAVVKAVRLEVTSHVRGVVEMLINFPGTID